MRHLQCRATGWNIAVLPMQPHRMPLHMALMSLHAKKRHNCTARAVCSRAHFFAAT